MIRTITLQGKPIKTVELVLRRAPGCFDTVTFSKNEPVTVIVIEEKNLVERKLESLVSAVEALEELLVTDLDALDNWQGAINRLFVALDKAREIVGTQGEK